jgi:hypothetical protein
MYLDLSHHIQIISKVHPIHPKNYRVRQKDLPYLERALCELWWGYGGGGGIDR